MQTEYREVAWALRWFPITSNRRGESRLAKWRTLSSGIGQRKSSFGCNLRRRLQS